MMQTVDESCGSRRTEKQLRRCHTVRTRQPTGRHKLSGMCRNIRQLYNFEPPATDDEVRSAALQYVRKISGYRKPSQANQAAFDAAVAEITESTGRLLDTLVSRSPVSVS